MKTYSIKTKRLDPRKKLDLIEFLDNSLEKIEETSVLSVSSKVVSIAQGKVLEMDKFNKEQLIVDEADLYYLADKSRHKNIVTIKGHTLVSSAGIDESNADGLYILWPEKPQIVANEIREYFSSKYDLDNFGVIITDTTSTVLRKGTQGVAIAYSGFSWDIDYRGQKDIFGQQLETTRVNVPDSLAVASVLEKGEGGQQTPLALITDVKEINFTGKNPSQEELAEYYFDLKDDMFFDMLDGVDWQNKNDK